MRALLAVTFLAVINSGFAHRDIVRRLLDEPYATVPFENQPEEVQNVTGKQGSASESSGSSINYEGSNDLEQLMLNIDALAQESGIACPADVLFVVDATGSMKKVFDEILNYMIKVLEGLTVSDTMDHVGVILYSSREKQKVKIPLGSINNPARLVQAVQALPFLSGTTATGAALAKAYEVLQHRRENVHTSVVVITDGFSFDSTEESASQLRNLSNTYVYTVSIGNLYTRRGLENIAGSPEHTFFGLTSYGMLVRLIKRCETKVDQLNQNDAEGSLLYGSGNMDNEVGRQLIPSPQLEEYSGGEASGLEYTSDAVSGTSPHARDDPNWTDHNHVDKTVKPLDSSSQNINSVINENHAEPACLYDILFIFDASGSLEGRFTEQLNAANRLIGALDIGADAAQVAAVKYAGKGRSRVIFDFKDFHDRASMQKRISEVRFMGGTTYTNEALMKAADILQGLTARSNKAKPIVILFTDGFSGEDPTKGAQALREVGALVYVVGLAHGPLNRNELETIAGRSSRVYGTADVTELEEELRALTRICSRRKKVQAS